jgi:hypothetical protein
MPGLPRKSTVKQFKKLMKKSGKSKTNTKAGGHAPSNRIATYEQYHSLLEEISWWKDGELEDDDEEFDSSSQGKIGFSLITEENLSVGLKIYTSEKLPFGVISEINGYLITVNTTTGSRFILPYDKFFTYKFTKKDYIHSDFEEITPEDLKIGLNVYVNGGDFYGTIESIDTFSDGELYKFTIRNSSGRFIIQHNKFMEYGFLKKKKPDYKNLKTRTSERPEDWDWD